MQEVEEVDTAEEEEPGDPQDPGQVSPHDGSRSWGGEPCAQREADQRAAVPGSPPCPPWPLLISPTLVCVEAVAPTGLLGALREGGELAAEGGVGAGAPPVRISLQQERDAAPGLPVGLAGRWPLLGAEFWVQHSQPGPSSTITPPGAHGHQGDRARSQESTADGEGWGLGGFHVNLHPHLGGPCGREASEGPGLGPHPALWPLFLSGPPLTCSDAEHQQHPEQAQGPGPVHGPPWPRLQGLSR